jgi:GNAT superfamily N-acetyltransferase
LLYHQDLSYVVFTKATIKFLQRQTEIDLVMYPGQLTIMDLEKIRHLQPDGWSDIVPDLAFYVSSEFCNPIKMVIDESIAGIGASIQFEHTAWLAHIIVDPAFRNRGIGFQIVNRLLEELEKSGTETCLLTATELGQPVYVRAGFRNVAEYIFLNREKPWQESPVSPHIIDFSEEYRSRIYKMDLQATGEQREQLLSPFLKDARLYVRNNRMMGYLVPGLREGLIVAESDEAGFALMNLKFALADKAALPADNKAGVGFLLKRGFSDTGKKGTRMILGKDIPWKPEMIYSRIGGNVG